MKGKWDNNYEKPFLNKCLHFLILKYFTDFFNGFRRYKRQGFSEKYILGRGCPRLLTCLIVLLLAFLRVRNVH